MDIRQTLFDTQSTLRDFIDLILQNNIGQDWMLNSSGLSEKRLKQLEGRKAFFDEKRTAIQEENSLLNYTEFIDLRTILQRHWEGDFELAFGDWETISTYLNVLARYFDPDSHNRNLLTHQKHLILGISGAIRNRIALYRSWKEKGKRGFPVIESVRDNFGNLWVPGKPKKIRTDLTLTVDDLLEFVVTANDPEDADLEYKVYPNKWTQSNVLQIDVEDKNVGRDVNVHIAIRGPRKPHAYPLGYDDRITFVYDFVSRSSD